MSKSLNKLIDRYKKAIKFNSDISSDGIRLTKDVIEFIKEKQLIGLKYSNFNNCYYIANKKLRLPKILIKKGKLNIRVGIAKYRDIACCCPAIRKIYVGKDLDENKIGAENIEKFTSECLTHETLHIIINEMFPDYGLDLTTMFDLIGHHLYNDKKFMYEMFNKIYPKFGKTNIYQLWLKRDGLLYTIENHFNIDINRYNQAFIIANKRLKNE